MSYREQLANLLRAKSIKRGDFTLASGKKSSYYLDCRLTTLDAEGARLTGYCVLELLDEMGVKPDAFAGRQPLLGLRGSDRPSIRVP
jgi:orotate phosphoribosyltransferase